jgi:unsaturated chondroitin disaccharide hydrolase
MMESNQTNAAGRRTQFVRDVPELYSRTRRPASATARLGGVGLGFLLVLAALPAAAGTTNGTAWTPLILTDPAVRAQYYLPDFSYAGYHWGEVPLPRHAATLQVTNFGAVPDDGQDDTAALKRAFAAAHAAPGPVVLKFPKGRFILTDILRIERSDFVLQGSGTGRDGTVIYMPKPLSSLPLPPEQVELDEYLKVNDKRQVEKERGIDHLFSHYAWSGGFIWVNVPGGRAKRYLPKYDRPEPLLATATRGRRGEFSLDVADATKLRAGQLVRLNWFNREGENSSLIRHLYDNQPVKVGSRHWESPDTPLITQEATIVGIKGNTVILKQPLLHDLRPEWTPTVTGWTHLSEVGIEDIRFEFAYDEYYAHHLEKGFNAIYLANLAHSWVRNVELINADSGILTDGVANVTIEDVRVAGRKCHYGVHCGDVYGLLARNLQVTAEVLHSLSFNTGSRASVYTHCTVTRAPALDQHSGANHQNLFDDVTIYEDNPERTFIYPGGDGYWAPTHGAFSTFWNIQVNFLFPRPAAQTAIKIQGILNGASSRVVGLTANYPIELKWEFGPYIEGVNRTGLAVPSLYEYQLSRRMAPPRTFLLSAPSLLAARARLSRGDAQLQPAFLKLLADADAMLKLQPPSIMDKPETAVSRDKHDYFSYGPYWWPDPTKPGGLPYVRRDGERNPAGENTDDAAFSLLGPAIETLGLAYWFSGDERYAQKAAGLARVWFLNPATRMNPNFQHAQAIPGITDGRGIGIIEARRLIDVNEGLALIAGSPAWTDADRAAFNQWLTAFYEWLTTSTNGRDEQAAENNHGTWYDVQAAHLALVLGHTADAKKILAGGLTNRLARQVEPDGSQPLELARTKSLNYSIHNLEALLACARLAEHVGVDWWSFATTDGRSLRAALAYLAPYTDPAKSWPKNDIYPADRSRLLPLLARFLQRSDATKLRTFYDQAAANADVDARWRLWLDAATPRSDAATAGETPMHEVIRNALAVSSKQYEWLLARLPDEGKLPRTFGDGKLQLVASKDWTSGFFPGSLWYLYEATGDTNWCAAAVRYTALLEQEQNNNRTHDVGFILNCSYGNGYRLTRDPHYREVLIQGARTLGTRFKPEVGLIRSWDRGPWQYPVIIDNMMNLELLTWSAREANEPRLRDIAIQHADKTLKNHFRPDASTWHVVDYNPTNGAVVKKQTHQGAADDSSWARGQAWALYGYTMMYRETRRPEYLAQAGKTACFLMNHPRLPEDKVPYWDFDAPDIPNAPRDTSAAAIMASALIELSEYVEPEPGRQFLQLARQQLRSLSSPAYLATPGENGGFLLRHCVGNLPKNSEVDVPLNYADYYFLEALLRYRAVLAREISL